MGNVQEILEREMQDEMCRLREMVDVLQQAVNDAETRALNEREAAKKAIAESEAAPVIKETVVMVEDTEKVTSLNTEVDRLKVSHSHRFDSDCGMWNGFMWNLISEHSTSTCCRFAGCRICWELK